MTIGLGPLQLDANALDIRDKTFIITGAGQGIGRQMAKTLTRHKANLAIIDRDASTLEETLEQCAGWGGMIKSFRLDVADEPAVEAAFRSIRLAFGAVDGLINNAGVVSDALLVKAIDHKVQHKMSLAEFNKVIAVDLIGVFLCGREAALHMIEGQRNGVIINVSSISRYGNVGQTNYSAAKAGVAAMTVTWAKELARHNIRVAGIAPGFVDTRMVAGIPSKIREKIVSGIPLRRLATPEEICHAAMFILQNDYFNGRVLEVDGGLRL
ncbi:MAG TPA: SDR family oxidoreductase [Xanthobacteraceae bacterium]|nr:SDR family oxidoreductase [Xanthobacteraceae bacterium]